MRWIAMIALVLSGLAGTSAGYAQDYPSHSIRLLVGFPPGSAADLTARLVGEQMSRTLGQQLVVETIPAPQAASPPRPPRIRRRTAIRSISAHRPT